jgi:hypothetical protein
MADNKFASVYDRFKQNTAQPAPQQSSIVSALGAPDSPDGTPQFAAPVQAQTAPKPSFKSVYDLYGQNKMNEFSAGAPKAAAKTSSPVAAKPVLGQTPKAPVGDIDISIPDDVQEPDVPVDETLPALDGQVSVAKPGLVSSNDKEPQPPAPPPPENPIIPEEKPSSGGGGGGGGGGGRGGVDNRKYNQDNDIFYDPQQTNVNQPDVPWPENPWEKTDPPVKPPVDPPVDPPVGPPPDILVDPKTGEVIVDPLTGQPVIVPTGGSVEVDENGRPTGRVFDKDGNLVTGADDPFVSPPPPPEDIVVEDDDPYGLKTDHGTAVGTYWEGNTLMVRFSDGFSRPAIIPDSAYSNMTGSQGDDGEDGMGDLSSFDDGAYAYGG